MGMPQHGLAAPPLSPISVELALGKNGCSAVSRSGDQGRAEVSWAVDDLSGTGGFCPCQWCLTWICVHSRKQGRWSHS